MVKKLVLFDKIYNIPKRKQVEDIYLRYFKYLKERVSGFPDTSFKIKKLRKFDKRFEIIIDGPEEAFIFNILKKEIGSIIEFNDVKVERVYKGSLIDVGKIGFGLFVDCAILNPPVDVLISLHKLREQLCNGKEKSLREIVDGYDFIDNFPLHIKITKKDVINNQLQGEIAPESLSIFEKILNESIEGVFLSGETKGQFKKIITKMGHFRDIITIKRFGFLENLVLLKEGTDALGIIAHIGKQLRNCKMSALRPNKIKALLI
jgi:hypothetical protein